MAQAQARRFGNDEVAVFQDSENCPFSITKKMTVGDILANILSNLRPANIQRLCAPMLVYSGNKHIYRKAEHDSIKEQGFRFLEASLRRRPCARKYCRNIEQPGEVEPDLYERSFNVVDSLLIEEMLGEALLGNLPPNVLLISTDQDFHLATQSLHATKRYNIFVARKRNTDGSLPAAPSAYGTWEWARMQKPGAPVQVVIRNKNI
ncbi:unnamed protein product [Arabidopsis arenosa]|uniref:NYN domain-containing protein n=1 Tax=Arabidopsis arenosa TaxID=38785 RepID=A0A8S2A1T2_ARAAE|nr:unnamed protein product [Arabidopsis arenosa]